ncbi:11525_t:CDS:2 [Funneliformis geosporum]|uniref:4905_t:CDS:1 n=1 Tax=Funneliformis geosporum TaxID=1117311 RepID=A0A9W4SR92_9GLOM|nr:11525_t:CDS:2 [Funneliformis geosporum]CAI2178000.1 4905_t:CDS:2 [Funneliformis geosporum]
MLVNRYCARTLLSCSLILTQLPRLFTTTSATLTMSQDSVTARVVFVTCPDEAVAKRLSRGLVEGKLAACVNVIHGITSLYWWDGKIEETTEQMLVIKTEEKHVRELTDYVNKKHGYEVPEVISIKIDKGSTRYLDWIKDSVKP